MNTYIVKEKINTKSTNYPVLATITLNLFINLKTLELHLTTQNWIIRLNLIVFILHFTVFEQ